MRRVVSCWLVLLMCSMSPVFVVKEGRAQSATVGFSPSTVVLGPDYCVGETFILAARIDDFTGLYGMGLKIEWNTNYLDYVEHVVKVPVETYPDGLLHRPIAIVKDFVDEAGGIYEFAATSLAPAPAFDGSGIAFEITFRVKEQPLMPEPDIDFWIVFTKSDLADAYAYSSRGVHLPPTNCHVIISSFHPANLNNDLIIDIHDVVIVAKAYGSTPIDPNWNPDCDLEEPYGEINIIDIIIMVRNYGEEYIPVT